jgi:hypothetical protein
VRRIRLPTADAAHLEQYAFFLAGIFRAFDAAHPPIQITDIAIVFHGKRRSGHFSIQKHTITLPAFEWDRHGALRWLSQLLAGRPLDFHPLNFACASSVANAVYVSEIVQELMVLERGSGGPDNS